jgi:hypothetical protein
MMNDSRSPLCRAVALAIAVGLALTMAGCAKKVTSVDASYTAPEGQRDADARLIVYADAPLTVELWADLPPDGPLLPDGSHDDADTLVSRQTFPVAPGTLHGTIFDGTAASGYQVLRRESNGGFAQLKDFVLTPSLRFLESHWETYTFSDGQPSGFQPPSYVGRGLVSGVVSAASPLTNVAELAGADIPELTYAGSSSPRDSNIAMSWEPVAGAAGYWIQIYQFTGDAESELLASQPAPLVSNFARIFFVGYVPAPATSYKLGHSGALVLTRRTLLNSAEYLVRITAVDDRGRMVGFSYGDWEYVRGTGFYVRYRLGAVKVTPRR